MIISGLRAGVKVWLTQAEQANNGACSTGAEAHCPRLWDAAETRGIHGGEAAPRGYSMTTAKLSRASNVGAGAAIV
jgi:hypothetical protein